MTSIYLAIDLGAQSGRVIMGRLADQRRLEIDEIHRFTNQMVEMNGHLHWDIHRLYREIMTGIKKASDLAEGSITSIAIDAWGVDFALLDDRDEFLGLPYAYRDRRTTGMIDEFRKIMGLRELYDRTGIQILPINTLFQIFSMKQDKSPKLAQSKHLLFIPDVFNYLLTGMKCSEYTYITTSQLYDPVIRDWDEKILSCAGITRRVLQPVRQPGSLLADLKKEVAYETGLDRVPVTIIGSHDTASAVAAVPALDGDFVYISSGTWSLMGIEELKPIINNATYRGNFTNEGGICGTCRVQKNIAGMWLLQGCKKKWREQRHHSYEELIGLAQRVQGNWSIIDPDDACFLNPGDMTQAIDDFCRRTGQPLPDSMGSYTRCILDSLALSYRHTLENIREFTNRSVRRIHIVGGGSRNAFLCQLTADATGTPVHAGPVEATAIGNILTQAMAQGQVRSLYELRKIVIDSWNVQVFNPDNKNDLYQAYERFLSVKKISTRERNEKFA